MSAPQQHARPRSPSPAPEPSAPFREHAAPRPAPSPHRTRPRLTEQIQIIRELWLLREQARVQAAERCFLAELERLLSGRTHGADPNLSAPPPPPPPYHVRIHPVELIAVPPAPPLPPHYTGYATANAATTARTTTTATTTTTTTTGPAAAAAAAAPALAVAAGSEDGPEGATTAATTHHGANVDLSAARRQEEEEQQQGPVTVLNDGAVFESNPPPRSEGSPARERPNSTSLEMEATRSRQRVTNLSAQFRARLEGQDEPDPRALPRSRSFGELVGQRTVSTVLDSAFRHRLESVLTRREVSAARVLREMYTGERDAAAAHAASHRVAPPRNRVAQDPDEQHDLDELDRLVRGNESAPTLHHRGDVAALETVVAALREEVAVLRNVVGASFDLQLDIQRSIRQEVAAAMSAPARVSIEASRDAAATAAAAAAADPANTHMVDAIDPADHSEMSDVTTVAHSSADQPAVPASVATTATSPAAAAVVGAPRATVVQAGRCAICMEKPVDAMLYACGHMCTCAMCGRQLLANGDSCPICRAPVRDVVRAFVVTE